MERDEVPEAGPAHGAVREPGGGDTGADPVNDHGPDKTLEVDPQLRQRAEKRVAGARLQDSAEQLSEHDVRRLVHELQVHQVELEMQNEELRQAQVDLGLAAERFSDLYDFAPVGYLSLDPAGMIVQANLAAVALFGAERREHLIGRFLSRLVAAHDLDQFRMLRRRLIAPELTESAELLLQPMEGEPFWARLEIVTRQDPTERVLWQVAISNIDAQKRADLMLQRLNEELEGQVERRTEQLTLSNRQLVDEIERRRQAERELREREEHLERRVAERTGELATLLNVARDLTSSLQIDDVLDIILRELRELVQYEACGIFLLQGKMLTLVAYAGPLAKETLRQSQATLDNSPLLLEVVHRGGPLIIADMLADTPLTTGWRETASSLQKQLLHRSRAWMGVPMIDKGEVIGVMRLDHLQPGFFTEQQADLVLTLASQAAIAVANARLYAQAQRVAVIEERQRLARELHDSVAQTFYSIALATHAAKAQLRQDAGRTENRLDHVLELAEAGLTEMKALIFDLQMEGLRRDGLVQALQRHVDALVARNDLRVRAELGAEPSAPLDAKEAVYGIAREALQNVVRHAGATELFVKLSHTDDMLCVEVRDNGKGFAAEAAGAKTLGLRSMSERATRAGGSVEISSAPGTGSVVRARIPTAGGGRPR